MDHKKRIINPEDIETRDFHQFLLGAVAPRPIAFVSTVNAAGVVNLAPYSFFNVFSSNPPIAVFSSNRRVSNNTTKDTLANLKTNPEAVINVVDYSIVRQMAIASVEFPSDVSEFDKSGLTPTSGEVVSVPMVLESPASMECTVDEIIPLGEHGGAGHLIICKIHRLHVREEAIEENGRLDPHKMDLMGRMGRAYYVRASGSNVFPIVQAVTQLCIGFDQLPTEIRESDYLTGNELAFLAGQREKPSDSACQEAKTRFKNDFSNTEAKHNLIKGLIAEKDIDSALALAFA